MKKRIQIDSAILSFFIFLTGVMYLFPRFYFQNLVVDDMMDFVGILLILKGNFLRMAARGFKKAHSQKSRELVTTGPYALTRNPMYLGSFLMGSGFVLLVWPWWSFPFFTVLFYTRFRPQIMTEEKFLRNTFKSAFEEYTRKVPRFFPEWKKVLKCNVRKTFPPSVLWTTKERWGLAGWPVLAVFLESMQEYLVYGYTDLHYTIFLILMSAFIFAFSLSVTYRYG